MLKIKNDVDLRVLEKYGFKVLVQDDSNLEIDEYYCNLAYKDVGNHYSIVIENDMYNRQITICPNSNFPLKVSLNWQLDLLYDLIKDNLVEKVEG